MKIQGTRKVYTLQEEKETKEFWDLLGGKGEYAKGGYLLKHNWGPRLFECSESTGTYEVHI